MNETLERRLDIQINKNIAFILGASIIDSMATYFQIRYNGCMELNPIMASGIENHGLETTLAITKSGLTGLSLLLLKKCSEEKKSKLTVVRGLSLAYGALLSYHLGLYLFTN